MTMEEIFLVTGAWVLLFGTALGFLVYWIFEKDGGGSGE